jgi:hypothetical protein
MKGVKKTQLGKYRSFLEGLTRENFEASDDDNGCKCKDGGCEDLRTAFCWKKDEVCCSGLEMQEFY